LQSRGRRRRSGKLLDTVPVWNVSPVFYDKKTATDGTVSILALETVTLYIDSNNTNMAVLQNLYGCGSSEIHVTLVRM
jgi:hypothetical protein